MSIMTVREIERAIEALTPDELTELYQWLDQHQPQPIDARLEAGIPAGHLDRAIDRALDEDKNNRTQPL